MYMHTAHQAPVYVTSHTEGGVLIHVGKGMPLCVHRSMDGYNRDSK